MSMSSWRECLISSQVDGTALTNTTTATSLLPAQAKYLLSGGRLDVPGKVIRVTATGRISTVVTTPGTFTFDLRFGSTAVLSSGAFVLNTTAQTNVNWDLEMVGTLRVVGSSATIFPGGTWSSHAVIGSAAPTAGTAGTHMIPFNAAPAVGTAFDSTATATVDLYGTWSVANAANSITLHQYTLEILN